MKITDVKCAVIGKNPVVRIVTDEGISGYGEAEQYKPYLKPYVLHYRDALIGMDPTDVERCMLKIRQRGGFKPWGGAVSVIEMALWDMAGKAAGLPVYKLLGGKVRDKVRCYNGAYRVPMGGVQPEDYAAEVERMKAAARRLQHHQEGIGFHSPMKREIPEFLLRRARPEPVPRRPRPRPADRAGPQAHGGLRRRDEGGARRRGRPGPRLRPRLDGAGRHPLRPRRRAPPHHVAGGHAHRRLRPLGQRRRLPRGDHARPTPIHTGEQIYLRQNFKELIESHAVNIIGPDPCDVGGIAELKWVAEYADLHGILMAPHGTGNGLLGLAALVQVCATLPDNYIAFEYPNGDPDWWYDIVDGLPDPLIVNGMIEVWDRPGMGVELNAERAKRYLKEEDAGFFGLDFAKKPTERMDATHGQHDVSSHPATVPPCYGGLLNPIIVRILHMTDLESTLLKSIGMARISKIIPQVPDVTPSPVKGRLLALTLPSLHYLAIVSTLDDGLADYIKVKNIPWPPKKKRDLRNHIDVVAKFVTTIDFAGLHKMRERRNKIAHEPNSVLVYQLTWEQLDTAITLICHTMKELDLIHEIPNIIAFYERVPQLFSDKLGPNGERIRHSFTIGAKLEDKTFISYNLDVSYFPP